MIEKLKTINPYDETEIDMDVNSVAGLVYENTPLVQKINELVDAVNGMLYWHENLPRFWQNLSQKENTENEEPAENVQDVDELEQAEKWVGKLCWFSQLYGCRQHIAILKRISESGLYVTDDGELHYAYCEPVKPDDDIIYKGDK